MFLVIKEKKSVTVFDEKSGRDLIMTKFSKEYLGGIRKVVRDVEDTCLEEYGYALKGKAIGNVFCPCFDYNTITLYFEDETKKPKTLFMNSEKEYKLYENNGNLIDEFYPIGYVINEIPSDDTDLDFLD